MVTAVITGASSGLGKEYINAIIAEYPPWMSFGWWPAARAVDKRLPTSIPTRPLPPSPWTLPGGEPGDFREAAERERAGNQGAGEQRGLWQVRGFLHLQPASQMGKVDVNCRALTAITRLCLPYMLTTAWSSTWPASPPLPHPPDVVYSATKAYVLALSKALHDELRPGASRWLAVCPGPMDTDFWNVAGVPEGKSPADRQAAPEDPREVAEKSLRAGQAWQDGVRQKRGVQVLPTCFPRCCPTGC